MLDPLISVIVPVYNSEKYLVNCIESIVCQDYIHKEIVLMDDGSTDTSPQICDHYAGLYPNVRVVHSTNRGPSQARNRGILECRGDYFIFVDSDDELIGGSIQKIVDELKKNPDADLIIYGIKSEKNNKTIEKIPAKGILEKCEFAKQYLSLYSDFLINSPCNKMYRKSIIDNTIFFPTDMTLGEDLIFNNRYIRKAAQFLLIDESFYLYKMREDGSLTTKYHAGLFDLYYRHYCDIVETLDGILINWDEKDRKILKNMYLRYIKQAINMTNHKDSNLTFLERYREIKRICRHELTRSCVKDAQGTGLYDFMLKNRFPMGIIFYIKLSKIKKTFQR